MNDICCGPDPEETTNQRRLALQTPVAGGHHGSESHDDVDDHDNEHDHGHGDDEAGPWWRDPGMLLPLGSGLLLLVGYILEWTGVTPAATIVLALSLAAGAWTFVPGAIRRLMRGRLGVGLLMTIAAVGAVLLGHVGEAAALAFLFSIAEALEGRAMDRARHGLRALLSLIPETATISKLSGQVAIPAAQIQELDILVVRPGERVATDGVVVTGASSIDTSDRKSVV